MFFVNNYTVFVLSAINMVFRGFHDADPSVLVLHDRHSSHLVDIEHVCILLIIKYYYILYHVIYI